MGFSLHPGELPFTTVRDAKWANRLEGHDWCVIKGEHGCTLEPAVVVVESVCRLNMEAIRVLREVTGNPLPTPARYDDGRALVTINLRLMPEDERIRRGIPPAIEHC